MRKIITLALCILLVFSCLILSSCEAVKLGISSSKAEKEHEHYLIEVNRKKPGHTAEGSVTYKCIDCEYVRVDVIEMLGHSYSESWTADATSHWYACTDENCADHRASEEEHTSLNEGIMLTDGEGDGSYVCDVCGVSYLPESEQTHEPVALEAEATEFGSVEPIME